MGLGLDNLRLKAARTLVLALWLHLPLVFGLAYLTHSDPIPAVVLMAVLGCVATAVVLRRNIAPLGGVLVALAFGGAVTILCGALQASPWHAPTPIYTATALALTLALCSGPAVLACAAMVLLPQFVLLGLGLAGINAVPSDPQGMWWSAAALALEACVLALLAQAIGLLLLQAQATATAARQEAESLWQQRTTAQLSQAQFVAGLIDRITGLAQDPAASPPATAPFPFAFAEVERAVDLLAFKLRGGCLTEMSGFAQLDLAAATAQMAGCLHDQSTRLTAICQASQGAYRAKVLHNLALDLEDITEQSQQIATFAADLSHTAEAYIKTPLLGRAHLPKMPLAPELCLGKPTKPIQARPWTLAA
jgi:hypothetical protein